jgi:archaellum biogenesis ATPase FlaH
MTLIQQYASYYKDFGWNLVPLFNHTKNPAPYPWKKFETEHMTDEEFNSWIDREDLTGVGVVTGAVSGVTVVDEDSYKADGMEFHLTSPLIAESANGGRHYYFKFNPDVKTTGFRKGVNLEIKSAGGFIVLPPSQVYKKDNETLGEYRWINQSIKSIDDLPTLDSAEMAQYKPEPEIERVSLLDLLDVEIGSQHNSLRDFTNRILWKYEPNEWERLAYPQIRLEAGNYQPPHPTWRVEKLIRDCSQFNLKKRNERLAPSTTLTVAHERLKERELEKIAPSTGFVGLDSLIKGFIPSHLYTLSGHTNVGKTSLACNFAVRVASQNKKVLYFALEPGNTVVDYLATVRTGKQFDELTDEDLTHFDPNIEIYTKEKIANLDVLVSVIRKLERYDLIIIDHIGYFVTGTANTTQEQSNAVKRLALLAKEKSCAVMMIAHMRKDVGDIPGIDDISGSGAFKQDSTEVLVAIRERKETEDKRAIEYLAQGYIRVLKTKCGPGGFFPIEFTHKSALIQEGL